MAKTRFCLVLLCALLGACTTTRAWEQPDGRVLSQRVKAGDTVTIVATNGNTYQFEVTSVGADALHGRRGRKGYKVAFSMIESIEVERARAWPGVVTFVGIVAAAGVYAMFENAEDQNWDFCGGN